LPTTRVVLYKDTDGTVPVLDWLDTLPEKAQDKCRIRLERLADLGHELRRPEADYLRDGVYELRASLRSVHYRILYFFHGNVAAVVSHGVVKERAVPSREIDLAARRKEAFGRDPSGHTFEEDRA
jgi:phage-related protein